MEYEIHPSYPSGADLYLITKLTPYTKSKSYVNSFDTVKECEEYVDQKIKAEEERIEFMKSNPGYIYPRES